MKKKILFCVAVFSLVFVGVLFFSKPASASVIPSGAISNWTGENGRITSTAPDGFILSDYNGWSVRSSNIQEWLSYGGKPDITQTNYNYLTYSQLSFDLIPLEKGHTYTLSFNFKFDATGFESGSQPSNETNLLNASFGFIYGTNTAPGMGWTPTDIVPFEPNTPYLQKNVEYNYKTTFTALSSSYNSLVFVTQNYIGKIIFTNIDLFDNSVYDETSFNNGYEVGYYQGLQEGMQNGENNVINSPGDYGLITENDLASVKQQQYDRGYSEGYNYALSLGDDNTLYDAILAVVDTPFRIFDQIFDFDVLGINIKNVVLSFASIAIVIFVIKRFI